METASFLWDDPQVSNWARNVQEGLDEYFWDEAIYRLTAIYDSFEPFMRFVVDMMIEGRKPEEISKMTKKPLKIVYQTVFRAKKRLKNAVLRNFC
jgi:hypothetical protein